MEWLKVFATAACYFVFHWQFFKGAAAMLGQKRPATVYLLCTFAANYAAFFLCSMLGLHLIVNWTVFFVLLFGEAILLKYPARSSFLVAMLGTQLGLAINILSRSLIGLVLDVPLIMFDNNMSLPGNMKAYPVLLGFLLAGATFWLVRRAGLLESLHLVLQSSATLGFLVSLLMAMQLYLCLNLLVYSIPQDTAALKWWSIKSCVFVLVGQVVSLLLTVRLGRLALYRSENQRTRQILAEERLRQQELQTIADTDPLTGCKNRAQAEKRLSAALAGGGPFCLCFVDLNGLKHVNDSFGHEMGDEYLLGVAGALQRICGRGDALFRYGGDEFLVLLDGASMAQAAERLEQAQGFLAQMQRERALPFPVTVSYGVAQQQEGADMAALIAVADARMYRMKRQGPGKAEKTT